MLGSQMQAIDINALIAFAFAALLLYVIARLLLVPIRLIVKLMGNVFVGGILLVVFNVVGSIIGLTLGINLITALVVGFLGVPGLVMLIIVQGMLG